MFIVDWFICGVVYGFCVKIHKMTFFTAVISYLMTLLTADISHPMSRIWFLVI